MVDVNTNLPLIISKMAVLMELITAGNNIIGGYQWPSACLINEFWTALGFRTLERERERWRGVLRVVTNGFTGRVVRTALWLFTLDWRKFSASNRMVFLLRIKQLTRGVFFQSFMRVST